MKVAISIPDDVFQRVERAAKRRGISRSELLTEAAAAFLDEQRGREVTASYDRAFGAEGPGAAPDDDTERFRRQATRRALLAVEW
jgi:predicted transcriptional regulator